VEVISMGEHDTWTEPATQPADNVTENENDQLGAQDEDNENDGDD
jgi:hypothetical protein